MLQWSIASIIILFQGYFQYRQALVRQMMGNTKAIVKGKLLLLESERVEALSINSQDDHDSLFLTGFVRAAMKKKVVYQ